MKRAYISMPLNTLNKDINLLYDYIHYVHDIKDITYHTGSSYKPEKLNNSDTVLFFIPYDKLNFIDKVNEWQGYLGKGQYSELQRALEQRKEIQFATIDYFNTLMYFSYLHDTINDYNNWKEKYGKVFLSNEVLPIHQVEDNLLLLLCLE